MTGEDKSHKSGRSLSRRALVGLLAGIVLLGLGLRLAHLRVVQREDFFRIPEMTADASYNHQWASQAVGGPKVSEGQPYYVAPLYMEFLRLLYWLAGAKPWLARLIQIVLGALNPLLFYWIARKFADRRAALLAALLCAVYPLYIFYEPTLIKTSVSVFLISLAMGVVLTAAQREKHQCRWWLLGGVLVGVAALVRPNVLLFVPLVGLVILWPGRRAGLRARVLYCGSWFLGIALAIAPVTLRNRIVADDWVLINSNGGFSFYLCNRLGADAYYQPVHNVERTASGEAEDTRRLAEKALGRSLKASEVSRFFFGRGMDAIKENPQDFARRTVRKASFVLNELEVPNTEDFYFTRKYSPVLRHSVVNYGMLLPWAVLGLLLCWKSRPVSTLVNLFMLSNVVVLVIFYVSARYRLPITPFVIIYAAVGLCGAWDAIRTEKVRRLVLGVVIVVAGYYVSHINIASYVKADRCRPLFNAAGYYLWKGRPRDALALLKQVEDSGIKSAEVSETMGMCCMQLRDYRQARRHLDEAIKRDPKQFSGYLTRARLRLRNNELDASVEDLKKVLSIKDTVAEAHYLLGTIRRHQGRLAEAKASLETANRLNPNLIGVYVELARFYLAQGDIRKARWFLEEGLARSPQDRRLRLVQQELAGRQNRSR